MAARERARSGDLHGFGEAIRREVGSRVPRGRLRVLDVGTGFGISLGFLVARLPKGSEVWTVDPSTEAISRAREELGSGGPVRVNFVEGRADDLNLADGHFDMVVSIMVLHHLGRLSPAVREMERVLKQGGTMVLVDYKPDASRKLEFVTKHEEADFYRPGEIVRSLRRLGLSAAARDFGLWYLIEATKEKGRASRQSGRATPKSAG